MFLGSRIMGQLLLHCGDGWKIVVLAVPLDLILQPLALILLPALSKSILLVANNSQQFNMELLRTLGYWPSGVFIGRIYVETSC